MASIFVHQSKTIVARCSCHTTAAIVTTDEDMRDLQHINGVLQHGSRLRSVSTTIWAMFLWTKISGYVSVTSLAFTRLSEHTIQAIRGAPLPIAIPKQSGNATRKPSN